MTKKERDELKAGLFEINQIWTALVSPDEPNIGLIIIQSRALRTRLTRLLADKKES
jgi:hypothetical protein